MFETGERAIFDLSVLENETNHPYRLQCEQLHLVKEAAKMLDAELSGALIFNAKALRVRQDEDGVAVDAEIEGTETTLQGRWLIGADGASSVVRKHLGLGFEGETYPTASVAIGTPFAFEKHIPDLCGVNYFWADGWSFSMFQTKDMWRVGYSPPPDMNAVAAVADDEIQMRLARILPSIGPFEIITARLYSVHRRLVEKMRVGRMLLAGDAAHLNSPSGGFGMNGGVHDAFNLADKLIKVWGGGDDTLLDLYARQRHYAASADIQKTSDANHKRHREKDHGRRLETLKAMQETISDEKAVHNFLRESSLMNSLERANALT
jgi:3-(3-hydroxy-phenyl)propionate hydroxylase